MMIRLVSVPHTGTVFTRGLLEQLGVEHTSHHTDELTRIVPPFPLDDPIVVPIRDPMLAEISRVKRGSGLPVKEWAKITDWRFKANVHWFEVPAGPVQVAELAWFCGVKGFCFDDLDLEPKNIRPDHDGLLEGYLEGDLDPRLTPAWEWLRSRDDVFQLFEYLGHFYPWMEDRWVGQP